MHKPFCFANQPAACTGYFAKDALPCVCGVSGSLLSALSQVAIPAVPIREQPLAEVQYLPSKVYDWPLSA